MLDQLKNQERLSQQEEDRIDRNARISVLVLTAAAVALIVWALVSKKSIGTWYYALIVTLLAAVWLIKCVLAGFLKHALAQRTDEQAAAYLKAAGLEFVSYAGLVWFLLGMNGNGIFGAVVYMFGMMGARKQREIYCQIPDEDTDDQSGQDTEAAGEKAQTSAQDAQDALPSAANRMEREKGPEDGSV